jgi:hypothetical protein
MAADSWYYDHMHRESRIRQAWIDQQAAAGWPELPEHIKAAVLALVRSTSDKGQSK